MEPSLTVTTKQPADYSTALQPAHLLSPQPDSRTNSAIKWHSSSKLDHRFCNELLGSYHNVVLASKNLRQLMTCCFGGTSTAFCKICCQRYCLRPTNCHAFSFNNNAGIYLMLLTLLCKASTQHLNHRRQYHRQCRYCWPRRKQ